MYHQDEVIDVETIAEDVDFFDAGDKENPESDQVEVIENFHDNQLQRQSSEQIAPVERVDQQPGQEDETMEG